MRTTEVAPIAADLQAWSAGLRPDPVLTVTSWADAHRVLPQRSSVEPGQYRSSRTPFWREIMDALSIDSGVEIVVVMKGNQLGATEVGHNWLGYIMHHAPGPAMMVQPTVTLAERLSKQRLAPMIEACPQLRGRVREARARDSGNTILMKEFPGGILVVTGANSGVGLRSMPVRYLFLDEVDGYPQDIDGEGDPVELAINRTDTYGHKRKVYITSTPTVRGLSRIEKAYARTDRRQYVVPCPVCGHEQPITWGAIRWPKDDPASAHMVCIKCEAKIQEHQKGTMLERGRWLPTAAGDPRVRGYQISGLYSPLGWLSWAQVATRFLAAKQAGPLAMKVWVNQKLGETWEETGETIEEDALLARREKYPAEVPMGALVLVAGVDIQDDRLELGIWGYGPGEQAWVIDHRVIRGNPNLASTWRRLDEHLLQEFVHESGERIRIAGVAIDTGYATDAAYAFCEDRVARRVYAVKGAAGFGRPVVSAPARRRRGRRIRSVDLFLLGVDEIKALLYSRLRLREAGPGYIHFPQQPSIDEEFMRQLTAEKLVTRYTQGFPRREWVKDQAKRNEVLDCAVYALAALYILQPVWDVIARRIGATAPPGSPPPGGMPQPRPRRRWVDRY